MKVFVYGTLQRGHGNHHILEDHKLVGPATTVTKYAMMNVGFPYMLNQAEGAYPCVGELWDIGDCQVTLARLDRLEGVGRGHYDRVKGEVVCNGKRYKADYYVKCNDSNRVYDADLLIQPVNGVLRWQRENVYE